MKNVQYYATVTGSDTIDYWKPLNAKTLTGAKREASRKLGDGYFHHTIYVGERLYPGHPDSPLKIVASRPMTGRW